MVFLGQLIKGNKLMFELFKIGFLTVSFLDVVDILIVSFIVYKLYMILRGTIAAQIFIGLIIIFIFRNYFRILYGFCIYPFNIRINNSVTL